MSAVQAQKRPRGRTVNAGEFELPVVLSQEPAALLGQRTARQRVPAWKVAGIAG